MTIRPATPEDVPAVLPMVRKVAGFHEDMDPAKYSYRSDPGELYRGWLTRKAADPRAAFLVADAAAAGEPPRVVGFLIGTVEPEPAIYHVREYGFLHDLWVEDEYRHEGVGRLLVMRALARFAEVGVKQVRLDVLVGNAAGRKLFEACGFRPSIVEMLVEVGEPGRGDRDP